MSQCTYSKNFIDFETGKEKQFECEIEAWKRGKCKFHSANYLKNKTTKEISEDFKKILDNAKTQGILQCIGYHLPTIELSTSSNQEDLDIIIYFIDTKFHGKIDFSNINFKKRVSFSDAVFYDTVSFRASEFEKEAKFTNTKFYGTSNSFQFTKFDEKVDFSYGEIKNAKFIQTVFNEANFNYRTFYDNTSFENSTFNEICVFKETIFKETTFDETTFNEVDFSESNFIKNVNFDNTKFHVRANFTNVSFSDQSKAMFDGNVSNVSFVGIEIDKMKFGNAITWKQIKKSESVSDKIKSHLNWIRNNDFKIYDERNLENQFKRNKEQKWWQPKKNTETNLSLESIKNAYRDLRENFDLNLRYETSGEFHVREMELKRKYREKHNGDKTTTVERHVFWKYLSIYWLYNMLGQYGQSYYRPIYFAISIISIATYYFLSNEIGSAIKAGIEYSFIKLLAKALARSVAGIIPLDIFNKDIDNTDKVLRVMLLPVSTTFFIALKRRVERKFRH